MKKSLITTLTIAILCLPNSTRSGSAQNATPSPAPLRAALNKADLAARLDKSIPQLMKDGDVPGLSLAIIDNGAVVWNRGYGVKNAATKDPVTDETVFEAASLSKPVFAYAALKLVDAGKLDLDKPLSQYLDKPYIDGDERLNLITARRVLTHTAGFPNWRTRGQALKIVFPPGERFSYSGEGFVYLQKVVERLTAQPLDDFVRKTVFEPLGMTGSSYVWLPAYETLKATGHDAAGVARERRKPTEANAASTLQTTALDYAKFVIAVMNGTGLKDETSKAMLSPQIRVDEGCSNCVNKPPTGKLSPVISWGFGVGLQQTKDGLSFWHWGDNGDVHCYVLAYPQQKRGMIVFTNSGNGHSIIPAIIREALAGYQPAIAWIGYEAYDSPARTFYKDIVARGVVAIDEYRAARKNKTASLVIDETPMNRLGYALLGGKRVKEAIEIFKLNVEAFPNSANTYDSLGEAYLIAGEKLLAIKNYEKSVELDPKNDGAIEALKKLRSP
jgi:CubicO group peptidase (beta-lactamase class C family)